VRVGVRARVCDLVIHHLNIIRGPVKIFKVTHYYETKNTNTFLHQNTLLYKSSTYTLKTDRKYSFICETSSGGVGELAAVVAQSSTSIIILLALVQQHIFSTSI